MKNILLGCVFVFSNGITCPILQEIIFQLNKPHLLQKRLRLQFTDVLGQNVLQILEVMPNKPVNVSNLRSGIYMVQITINDNIISAHKLIIAK